MRKRAALAIAAVTAASLLVPTAAHAAPPAKDTTSSSVAAKQKVAEKKVVRDLRVGGVKLAGGDPVVGKAVAATLTGTWGKDVTAKLTWLLDGVAAQDGGAVFTPKADAVGKVLSVTVTGVSKADGTTVGKPATATAKLPVAAPVDAETPKGPAKKVAKR